MEKLDLVTVFLVGIAVVTTSGFSINSSDSPLYLKQGEALRLFCEIDSCDYCDSFDSCAWTLPSGCPCELTENASTCFQGTSAGKQHQYVKLERMWNRCMLEIESADIFRDTGTYTCTFSKRFRGVEIW